MDVLTVSGLGNRLNGDYDCDVIGLLDVASDEALTVREANFVKTYSGVRGGEIGEAFLAGDRALVAALAVIILRRNDKRIEETLVWDYPSGWARFTLGVDEQESADPPTEAGETSKTEKTPSPSGGMGSYLTLASPDDDQSRTGLPASDTSATSDLATSAT